MLLQQYLPFTVLKPSLPFFTNLQMQLSGCNSTYYGIETLLAAVMLKLLFLVATVLTVYGIETLHSVSFQRRYT